MSGKLVNNPSNSDRSKRIASRPTAEFGASLPLDATATNDEVCPNAAVTTGEASRLRRQHPQTGHPLRRYGIEEHIKRRDLSIADDDHIQACIVGRLAARPRSPRQPPGIVEGLGLAMGGVNEVRMGRAEIASKLVEGFGADEYLRTSKRMGWSGG